MTGEGIVKKNTGLLLCLTAGMVFATSGRTAESPLLAQADISEHEIAASLYEQGVRRINGEGGTQDIAQGRYWIHLAARHGYPLAQYNLGVMYFDGISGAYNRQCAQWWLTRAAAQDDPEVYPMAQQALQSIVPEMALLPKVYRPVTAVECDRLPAWHAVTDVSVLSLAADDAADTLPGEVDERGEDSSALPETSVKAVEAPEAGDEVERTVGEGDVASRVRESIADEGGTLDAQVPALPVVSAVEGSAERPDTVADTEEEENPVLAETAEADDETETPVGQGEVASRASESTVDEGVTFDAQRPALSSIEGGAERPDTVVDTEGEVSDVANAVRPTAPPASAVPAPTKAEGVRPSGEKETVSETVAPTLPPVTDLSKTPPNASTNRVNGGATASKPAVVTPKPTWDLGGSPATASGAHYTVQLSGGTTPEELHRIARKHKLRNYVVYETERHGRRWYVLVAGEYATLSTATQAVKHLPAELRKNGPWVRSVRQVQTEISKQ